MKKIAMSVVAAVLLSTIAATSAFAAGRSAGLGNASRENIGYTPVTATSTGSDAGFVTFDENSTATTYGAGFTDSDGDGVCDYYGTGRGAGCGRGGRWA